MILAFNNAKEEDKHKTEKKNSFSFVHVFLYFAPRINLTITSRRAQLKARWKIERKGDLGGGGGGHIGTQAADSWRTPLPTEQPLVVIA